MQGLVDGRLLKTVTLVESTELTDLTELLDLLVLTTRVLARLYCEKAAVSHLHQTCRWGCNAGVIDLTQTKARMGESGLVEKN